MASHGDSLMSSTPKIRGLYDPQWEHDACGIGAIVNISGARDHAIVEHGKQVLLNLMHRGAAGADESTGDGAGILMQLPHEFLAEEADRLGFALPAPKRYGVAMLFLPRDAAVRRKCEELFRRAVEKEGLALLGWRDVPADNRCLGQIARSAEPIVRQAFIGGNGLEDEQLERRLFVVRKRTEHRVGEELGEAAEEFYVPSMSCRTIATRACSWRRSCSNIIPTWPTADPDGPGGRPPALQHQHLPELAAGPAVPHDRPQRRDQHAAGQHQPHPGLREDDVLPGLGRGPFRPVPHPRAGRERLGLLRQLMELLVRAGRSAPHALMMMIPEAFGPRYHISIDKRAFYEYHAAIMEPWDGPAAMVFTDGRLVGGTLDRNGLRPCRYVVTTDGLVVLASEVGRDRVPARADRAEGPASARPHVPGRYARGPDRRRQRGQGQDRPPEALPPLAGAEPDRAAGPVPALEAAPRSIAARFRQRLRAFGYTPGRAADDPRADGRERPGAGGLDGHRHAAGRALEPAASCCSATSSNCSPR